MLKKVILIVLALGVLSLSGLVYFLWSVSQTLPQLITVDDYKPLLTAEVFDRNGEKIGEFGRQKRTLVKFEDIPKDLINAFLAAEDDQFFSHNGINYTAIFRAFLANLKAGRTVQGGSTITQQVAKTLLLSDERTLIRKVKEALLATKMERHLSKEDILYLYLNQIFFGQNAYGIVEAAQVYFRKDLKDLKLEEMAILAGLPQAPSRYAPIRYPKRAKARQIYVLKRMADVGFITPEQRDEARATNVEVFSRRDFQSVAPHFVETIRLLLTDILGSPAVQDDGIQIYSSLDVGAQRAANEAVEKGLRELDKRQGFRGAKAKLKTPEEIALFLVESKNEVLLKLKDSLLIFPDGTSSDARLKPDEKEELQKKLTDLILAEQSGAEEFKEAVPAPLKIGEIVPGVVVDVDDKWGLSTVRFLEGRGLIDISTMEWARTPNPAVSYKWDKIKKPSQALKVGDVVDVRIVGQRFESSRVADLLKQSRGKNPPTDLPNFSEFAELHLEQEPMAESSLFSIDLDTEEVISMVGGFDFKRSEYNRALQANRQTGSAFKAIVFLAGLDKGYTPSTRILDAPVVYEEEIETTDPDSDTVLKRKWKPENHSKKYSGDILYRTVLLKSLNVPTIKIMESLGVDWVISYARRLGIFSPLNPDLTVGLGSSGVTLYEMTKAFAVLGKGGRRVRPLIVHKVTTRSGEVLLENLTLDAKFQDKIDPIHMELEAQREFHLKAKAIMKQAAQYREFNPSATEEESLEASLNAMPFWAAMSPEEQDRFRIDLKRNSSRPQFFFEDPDQLISPQTAFVATSLLQAAIQEGTGARARALGRPVAGKTGSTNDYFDAWFMGYTPQVASGVWVGFDQERRLGAGEVGGVAALPIWLDYMKAAHANLPEKSFAVPESIVMVNIDKETGDLASAYSKNIVRQAFVEGTEPKADDPGQSDSKTSDFLKEDFFE